MSEPIPRKILDAACRKFCRRLAACLIRAMAETDSSFAQIAERLSVKESEVRAFIQRLIDGDGSDTTRWIADMAYAMDCEIEFTVHRIEPAQGIEARRGETRSGSTGSEVNGESPVAGGDAP